MTQPPVVVYTAAGPLEANIIKGLLKAAGIPAQLSQESAGAVYGFTVGAMGMVEVLVAGPDAAKAKAIIAAVRRGELENPNEAEPPE
jgi:hypothetical protein